MISSSLLKKTGLWSKRFLSGKVFTDPLLAMQGLKDGMTIAFGGFQAAGVPENSIKAIHKMNVKNLVVACNDAGFHDFSVGVLITHNQVAKIVTTYLGDHKLFVGKWQKGEIELEMVPQGTLAEKMRSAGAGIPAFYTPTGVGTLRETGGYPTKFSSDGKPVAYSPKLERRVFGEHAYLLEESLPADFACIKAWRADREGNLQFRATARNFNVDAAKCAKVCVAEVEELVENGTIPPDNVHLPGIYVHRLLIGQKFSKRIEGLRYASNESENAGVEDEATKVRQVIGRRVAKEFRDGMYVNLGIGIPTVACNYRAPGIKVVLQSENGLLGIGPYPQVGQEDPDLVNAGKETITFLPTSSSFQSSESFAMIRGGHIDMTILGALQVSADGDLASWIIPGKAVKGFGGAMDLVASCKKVVVAASHVDPEGKPKILPQCTFPLTGKGVVDMIITELAVFHVDRHHGGGLTLLEHAPGVTVEEIRAKTAAPFTVSPNLKPFLQ